MALLAILYPWTKALHIIAVISWMAGLLYLPRLFVHHVERRAEVPGLDRVFASMEAKLMRVIMRPAMIATWVLGLALVLTPGIVDWSSLWPWVKACSVIAMTGFHHWLAGQQKLLESGAEGMTGRQYRMLNEVPTVLMIVIVLSVVLRF